MPQPLRLILMQATKDVCLRTPEMKSKDPDVRILLTSGIQNRKIKKYLIYIKMLFFILLGSYERTKI